MVNSYSGKINKSYIEEDTREITLEETEGLTMDSRQVSVPGIDSNPIKGDQGIAITLEYSKGKTVCVGVITDSPEVDPGEIKIFSRDSSGAKKGIIYIKSDGIIEINGNADFAVKHTALNSALQTFITALNAVLGTKLDGSGTPGTLTLDISGAKVDTVKL